MLSRTWVRIALSYALLVLAAAAILAFLLGDEFEKREEAALRARLGDQARAVAAEAAPLLAEGAPISDTNSLTHKMASIFGTRVTLIRPDGRVVGDSEQAPAVMENHATRPEVEQALVSPSELGTGSRLSATVHRQLLYVAVAVTDPASGRVVGVARVAYPLTSVEQARDALWSSLVPAVLLIGLLAALLGTLLARSLVGPISALRQVTARFGAGDLAARADPNAGGEIGDLGREFNAMAEELSSTIRRRTDERNQIEAVLLNMHDGILITDRQGLIRGSNPAAARLFNSDLEKIRGVSLVGLTHSHELHTALRAALEIPSKRHSLEIETDGSQVVAVVTGVPGDAGGEPTGLVVLQDVTELRRLERARRDFVANIGHELRTPLASIKLLVETLLSAVRDDPDAAEGFLRRIDVEIDGLTQLVRELLELSKIESGQVQLDRRSVTVGGLLAGAADRLRAQAERAGLSLKVEAADGLPPAYADPARIEQVLVNLLHNAIKFTPPGGCVVLRAEANPAGLRISVADTGIGIPREEQPRLFERFYKVDKARTGDPSREGGTGLGLAISKHIVQAHGGRIWISSRPNQGATFFFTLPTAPAAELVNSR
ncbi:MAG: ATP-binding protein [Chloroflexia bacterium]